MMNRNLNQPLNILIGRELSSLEFVRDYVQLRFDGPCLTAITDPTVHVRDKVYKRNDMGYCDEMCSLIGLPVTYTTLIEGKMACIKFSEEKSIQISLMPGDYVTPEALKFDDGIGNWWLW